jgi:hypothetical protein
MNVSTLAGVAFASITVALGAQHADAALDLVPAPGGPPTHLRIASTTNGLTGPQTATSDLLIRRTGPTTVVLQRNTSDFAPLTIGVDGSLHIDSAAPAANDPELANLLSALNIAHGVIGVSGAGDRAGWTARIPVPPGSGEPVSGAAAPAPAATLAAPLMLPMRAVAAGTSGDLNIDGSVETTLTEPAPSEPQHSRGGGFGGFGRGGFGGSRGGGFGGGGSPRGPATPPITLDVHVDGLISHNALAHLLIAQTRRVVLEGLTYDNVSTATIDVVH